MIGEELINRRRIAVVDPALAQQTVAHDVDEQPLELGRPAVAAEQFARQDRAALRPRQDVVDAEQFPVGAARDFG